MKTTRKIIICMAFMCAAILFNTISMSAQSAVYFFFPSLSNVESTLKLNGEELCELRGPVKKVVSSPYIAYEVIQYEACKRKCILREEGKVLFSIYMSFLNPLNGDVSHYAGEIQINIVDGDTHYVNVARYGLNDIQFKELNEKQAKKFLKNKKYIELPDYIKE